MADIVGWRIVKAKHARGAFSGEGARIYEGRWNSAGVRMVYCSENLALAALEILVHTQPVGMHEKWRAYRVSWSERMMTSRPLERMPKGWNAQPAGVNSRRIGDEWIASNNSPVLALPSVIIPLERTFLLNPAHADFGKIRIKEIGDFVLDQRLRS